MEIIQIANKIQEKIDLLDDCRKELEKRAIEKAQANGKYEKMLAKAIIALKNGEQFNIEGEVVQNPPATTTEKIARGICFEEKIASDLAEASYKNLIVGIDLTQSQLNGYQSINRFLSEK